eukprot:TRINITY_DN824_c0_g2_i2.p1 TRINITY_DN824_c0_g2~~TRINITY_DN824_c0_g2_i2.p1  ORF type:complete len:710 (-),score=132.97 TRINITY_DN824_c0_g2_i2:497-2626(-)
MQPPPPPRYDPRARAQEPGRRAASTPSFGTSDGMSRAGMPHAVPMFFPPGSGPPPGPAGEPFIPAENYGSNSTTSPEVLRARRHMEMRQSQSSTARVVHTAGHQRVDPQAKSSKELSMGSKPIAVMDDPMPYAAVLDELRSLNANFAHLVAGQNELRSSVGLRFLNFGHQQPRFDGFVGHGHVGHVGGGYASRPENVGTANMSSDGIRTNLSPRFDANAPVVPNPVQVAETYNLEQIDLQVSDENRERKETGDQSSPKSRSSFNALRTKDEDIAELRSVLIRAEDIGRNTANQKTPVLQRLHALTPKEKELALDSCIGFVIVVNAAFIGYSIDAPVSQESIVFNIDVFFSVVFVLELLLKLRLNGLRGQFSGEAAKMNIFDASIILVDTTQLLLSLILSGEDGGFLNLPSISLLRVLRLVRLARMLRLLRFKVFDELIMMVGGMMGGVTTLFWAMVLYFFAVYLVSLMFRETLGHRKIENIFEYFQDVPRSMFTVFRCSFGDCSSAGGMPIFEHVEIHYGVFYSLLYCLFMFSMTIGLFNVISAIFVDATLAAAASMRFKAKKARLQDGDLWATRICTLVSKLAAHENIEIKPGGSLVDILDDIYEMDVKVGTMAAIAGDEEVKEALDDLEIDPEDHEHLAVILDPDQGGSIAVIELIEGIKRLRGDPKRSDIVQIELMLRSIMRVVQEIQASAEATVASSAAAPVGSG